MGGLGKIFVGKEGCDPKDGYGISKDGWDGGVNSPNV